MKKMMMILTAAALLGCYEKDPIPEGLTEDNFYIGTFTFTDFADGEKPESYTFEITDTSFSIYEENELIDQDNKFRENFDSGQPNSDYNEYGIDWTNSKKFQFSGVNHIWQNGVPSSPEEHNWKNMILYEFRLEGADKGFDFYFTKNFYDENEEPTNDSRFIEFSTYETKASARDSVKSRYPQTLEWNGKRYKSTVEAAFAK